MIIKFETKDYRKKIFQDTTEQYVNKMVESSLKKEVEEYAKGSPLSLVAEQFSNDIVRYASKDIYHVIRNSINILMANFMKDCFRQELLGKDLVIVGRGRRFWSYPSIERRTVERRTDTEQTEEGRTLLDRLRDAFSRNNT